jgi:hypothetical protein
MITPSNDLPYSTDKALLVAAALLTVFSLGRRFGLPAGSIA